LVAAVPPTTPLHTTTPPPRAGRPPPTTELLSDADLVEIRATLQTDRTVHLERLAWLDEAGSDRFDDRAATAALRSLLLEIDAALQRLDHGGYGLCETCGGPVPASRLLALPHTTRCIECV
jgi:RNA polymerase-binding transcription factor DksA